MEGLEKGMGGAVPCERWSRLCVRGGHGCWSVCLQRRFLLVVFYIFPNFDAARLAADSEGLKASDAYGELVGALHLLLVTL